MSVIKYQNQSHYAFLVWMGSYPQSGHPYDEERFRVFAKSVAKYRSQKWLDHAYFEQQVLAHTPRFDTELLDKYWGKLVDFVHFYKSAAIPTVAIGEDKEYRFVQRGVKNGKMYQVAISETEYMKGGATAKTMRQAQYF